MTKNEWMDLSNMLEVANAQFEGWEIEVRRLGDIDYGPWDGRSWGVAWNFRGCLRLQSTKKIKIFGWVDVVSGRTSTAVDGWAISGDCVRYPKLDDEIEVLE
jgi:hypothetical protein